MIRIIKNLAQKASEQDNYSIIFSNLASKKSSYLMLFRNWIVHQEIYSQQNIKME